MRGAPGQVRVRHAGPAAGAFGGAPYGSTKREKGVPSRARVRHADTAARLLGWSPLCGYEACEGWMDVVDMRRAEAGCEEEAGGGGQNRAANRAPRSTPPPTLPHPPLPGGGGQGEDEEGKQEVGKRQEEGGGRATVLGFSALLRGPPLFLAGGPLHPPYPADVFLMGASCYVIALEWLVIVAL
eukprot:5015042-Pyramimonas_sp.AAC.1